MSAYERLIAQLKPLELFDSLQVVQSYLQFLQFGQPLPKTIQVHPEFYTWDKIKRGFFEWDLDILVKEIILNAQGTPGTNRTLRVFNQLVDAVNNIKTVEDELYKNNQELFRQNLMPNLFRLLHRQVPWQIKPNSVLTTRYFKIYNTPRLAAIVQNRIGISVKEIYTMGLGFTGFLLNNFYMDPSLTPEIPGVNNDTLRKFVANLSIDLEDLRNLISKNNSFDQDYFYNFNPLRQYPIVNVALDGVPHLMSPIPRFLFNRFTDGLFFEICNEPGFSSAYGEAYEQYIGEVLKRANQKGRFLVFREEDYSVNKASKKSSDWLIRDNSANLFIECKAKRLRAQGKVTLTGNESLSQDLDVLADAIVQTYKTINHYKINLYPSFKNNGKKVYPLIVTLDDWIIFGPQLLPEIENRVKVKLKAAGISVDMIEEMPYAICSVEELEILAHVIAENEIDNIMTEKAKKAEWTMYGFLNDQYKSEFQKSQLLFPNEYASLLAI